MERVDVGGTRGAIGSEGSWSVSVLFFFHFVFWLFKSLINWDFYTPFIYAISLSMDCEEKTWEIENDNSLIEEIPIFFVLFF